MFSRVKNREEEVTLLYFSLEQAKYNKELITELESFEVEIKSNGVLHKGKDNKRLALIRALKKENKKLKEFFTKHKEAPEDGEANHMGHRYGFNSNIDEGREHLSEKYKKVTE